MSNGGDKPTLVIFKTGALSGCDTLNVSGHFGILKCELAAKIKRILVNYFFFRESLLQNLLH